MADVIGRRAALRRAPRRPIAAVLALVLATGVGTVVVGSCSAGRALRMTPDDAAVATAEPSPAADVAPAPSAAVPPADAARVLAVVGAVAAVAGGRVTVAVTDAGGTPLLTAPDATAPAFTASLVKVLVVVGLLARDAPLDDADLGLVEAALVTSDDDAMNALWVRHDGARLVSDLAARLGLTGTAPPAVPGQWGQATTTARDTAVLLSSLEDVLGEADAGTMLGWLRSTAATAADGFDQAFGLLSGVHGAVGAKQGWMCCVEGYRQLHSAGVLADGRVVVLLGSFPRATPWAAASTALDAAAAAVLAGIG